MNNTDHSRERQPEPEFGRARPVSPPPIQGTESSEDLLRNAFNAYVGRQERTAFDLMCRSIEDNYATFLTLSGAMTPAGLHQSCLAPLLERGAIDCITTTGANLYHDAHRILGHRIREINPDAGDRALREAGIIRIYDLGFEEEVLLDTDRFFSAMLLEEEFQKSMTTAELHDLMGARMVKIEKALGVTQPSLLSLAHLHRVPIYVGAVQDGSIFLNIVKLKRLLGDDFRLEIDINADVFELAALQHDCSHTQKRKLAIWILGGGVPKNYTLQSEPLLGQILGLDADGFDIDVQFCVDPVDNGALSSCPASEGHTWGKVSAEGVEKSVYVHCDVTAVFPWLTHALLSVPDRRKNGLSLLDRREEATSELDRQIRMREKALQDSSTDSRIC